MPLRVPDPDVTFPIETSRGVLDVHLRGARMELVDVWESNWKPHLERAGDASAAWDWRRQVEIAQRDVGHACWALLHDGENGTELDGLISLSHTDAERSRVDQGAPLLYVEWVASAPHNRKAFGSPLLPNVLIVLLGAAIDMSRALGCGGRIGLHATSEAEGYYRDKIRPPLYVGTKERYPDGEWLYFEGTPTWAAEFWPPRSEG